MDPDSDPAPDPDFRQQLTRSQQKIFFFKAFCLLLFEGTFTAGFKDKTSKIV
jgi:hypothetical protein